MFFKGDKVKLSKPIHEIGLREGTFGTVWTMYESLPPSYEVRFCIEGRYLDLNLSDEDLERVDCDQSRDIIPTEQRRPNMNDPKVGQTVASRDSKETYTIASVVGLRPFDIWTVRFLGDKEDKMIEASTAQNGWIVR